MTREEAITLLISIHALLAESDVAPSSWLRGIKIFQSTLSLRRATFRSFRANRCPKFQSTLSLRRATTLMVAEQEGQQISIHALLAESDTTQFPPLIGVSEFQSTLSLRRATATVHVADGQREISIHALLAESDDGPCQWGRGPQDFNPRSPCGERPGRPRTRPRKMSNFNPRSPCGERLFAHFPPSPREGISIHALLAESDGSREGIAMDLEISIHALLAESDGWRRLGSRFCI